MLLKKFRSYKRWMLEVQERLAHIEKKVDKVLERNEQQEKIYAKQIADQKKILGYLSNNGFEVINSVNKKEYLSAYPDSFLKGKHQAYERNCAYFIGRNKENNIKDYSRLLSFTLNIEKILADGIDGAFAELGVYKGSNAAFMVRYANDTKRKMYLIDTFEGFDEQDLQGVDSQHEVKFTDTSIRAVKDYCGESENTKYIKGYFPDSITEELFNERFAFVSLDCDLYNPIMAGLEFFWDRMNKGGMIFIHDYSSGYYEGCTLAVDEFCKNNMINVVLMPDKSGTAVLVK
ncbi:MAG: TylF/MycF family methyltransferase [Pseudobutyrivibrio sp.]|nr:TylF/MycF family methyltransferase [Pseudobutyrivibrio sp.]